MQLKLAFDNSHFIAWTTWQCISILFLMLFARTFYYGRFEYRKHRRHLLIFQRLRFACMLSTILDFLWSFPYCYALSAYERVVFFAFSSTFDFVFSLLMSTICYRIFLCYFQIKCRRLPRSLKVFIALYVCTLSVGVLLEIFNFGVQGKGGHKGHSDGGGAYHSRQLYWYFIVVWLAFDVVLFCILSYFMLSLLALFRASFHAVEHAIFLDSNKRRVKSMMRKMILLCLGFVCYFTTLLASYFFFFYVGQRIQSSLGWILGHYMLGHGIIYCTFYLYVKVRKRRQGPAGRAATATEADAHHFKHSQHDKREINQSNKTKYTYTYTNTSTTGAIDHDQYPYGHCNLNNTNTNIPAMGADGRATNGASTTPATANKSARNAHEDGGTNTTMHTKGHHNNSGCHDHNYTAAYAPTLSNASTTNSYSKTPNSNANTNANANANSNSSSSNSNSNSNSNSHSFDVCVPLDCEYNINTHTNTNTAITATLLNTDTVAINAKCLNSVRTDSDYSLMDAALTGDGTLAMNHDTDDQEIEVDQSVVISQMSRMSETTAPALAHDTILL